MFQVGDRIICQNIDGLGTVLAVMDLSIEVRFDSEPTLIQMIPQDSATKVTGNT